MEISHDTDDLTRLVCRMQALVRGALVRRSYLRVMKEYEDLACSLEGLGLQDQQSVVIKWSSACLCKPRFTSSAKGPEYNVLERLAKRQWRKPHAVQDLPITRRSSPEQQPPTSPSPPTPAVPATSPPPPQGPAQSADSAAMPGHPASVQSIQILAAEFPNPPAPVVASAAEQSDLETNTPRDGDAGPAACECRADPNGIPNTQESGGPVPPSSGKEMKEIEPEGNGEDSVDRPLQYDSWTEGGQSESRFPDQVEKTPCPVEQGRRLPEQSGGQGVKGPKMSQGLDETGLTDLTLVSSIESSTLHLTSSDESGDEDDHDDHDVLRKGDDTELNGHSVCRMPAEDLARTGRVDVQKEGSGLPLSPSASGSSVRTTSSSRSASSNDRDPSQRTSASSAAAAPNSPARQGAPSPDPIAMGMEARGPHRVATSSIRGAERDGVQRGRGVRVCNPGPIGSPERVSSESAHSTQFKLAAGGGSSFLSEVRASDSLGQSHNASVAEDVTSMWSLDQSDLEGEEDRGTSPEREEDRGSSSSDAPLDAGRLSELRSSTAMELLWIEQAIESRKNYLRLKNKIGRGEPSVAER